MSVCDRRSFTSGVVAALLLGGLSLRARAQNPPLRATGSVNIHQVQIAFIGSGTTGGGTLYFHGRAYPFRLGGLGIGGIGISTIDATGTVYNLFRLEDFNGVYGQAQTGFAIGQQGGGQMWLQNSHGVYLKLQTKRQGLALSLGAGGMSVQLGT
jgi:hypothetical protein